MTYDVLSPISLVPTWPHPQYNSIDYVPWAVLYILWLLNDILLLQQASSPQSQNGQERTVPLPFHFKQFTTKLRDSGEQGLICCYVPRAVVSVWHPVDTQ